MKANGVHNAARLNVLSHSGGKFVVA